MNNAVHCALGSQIVRSSLMIIIQVSCKWLQQGETHRAAGSTLRFAQCLWDQDLAPGRKIISLNPLSLFLHIYIYPKCDYQSVQFMTWHHFPPWSCLMTLKHDFTNLEVYVNIKVHFFREIKQAPGDNRKARMSFPYIG